MMLAHELGHIALGHRINTKLAFTDRFFFPDIDTFQRLDFGRSPADEQAADQKAVDLLTNSPYKDKLSNAGLFLKALQNRAPELTSLIKPHLDDTERHKKTSHDNDIFGENPCAPRCAPDALRSNRLRRRNFFSKLWRRRSGASAKLFGDRTALWEMVHAPLHHAHQPYPRRSTAYRKGADRFWFGE